MFRVKLSPRYLGPTSNPVQDAENYYADREDEFNYAVDHSYECTCCGQPTYLVNNEKWYEIDLKPYCSDCAEHYKYAKLLHNNSKHKCCECGLVSDDEYDVDFYEFDGKVYCDECMSNNLDDYIEDYDYISIEAEEAAYNAHFEEH